VPVTTTSERRQLASSPLAEIVPRLTALVGKMTVDDVAALLGHDAPRSAVVPDASPSRAAPSRAAASIENLDDIARAILALPDCRHRLREVERAVVHHALLTTNGNVSAAARLLGTERKALERRIERYKIAVRRGSR
jgi:DNA-binding NtrC family response regulator